MSKKKRRKFEKSYENRLESSMLVNTHVSSVLIILFFALPFLLWAFIFWVRFQSLEPRKSSR